MVNKCNHLEISEALKNGTLPPLPNLIIDIIEIEDVDDEYEVEEWGTADVLRHISFKINKNVSFILNFKVILG